MSTPSTTDLNAELTQLAVDKWVKRVKERMSGSSQAAFVMGEDFGADELEWIRDVLVPKLKDTPYNLNAGVYYHGSSNSCDCYSSPCHHVSGRKFIVTLKK
jgi:hypothetical protein